MSICCRFLQCSQPCGGGVQYRMVVCQQLGPQQPKNVDYTVCAVTSRPQGSRVCNTGECAGEKRERGAGTRKTYPQWSKGSWSQVSADTPQHTVFSTYHVITIAELILI